MSAAKVVVVIPARYGSTRLPGKPLVLLAGKPMIQRVYERAKMAERADRVIVATDDERIVKTVEGFGGEARMTRTEHRTGTERVAEVAAHEQGDVFVNVQGDEPLLDPGAIDVAVNALLEEPQASIGTVATPIKTPGDIMDPNVVKVVLDFDGNAIYFSRAPIPWVRERGCAGRPCASGKASTEINPPGQMWPGGPLRLVSIPQGCRAIEPAMTLTRLFSAPIRKTVFESTA